MEGKRDLITIIKELEKLSNDSTINYKITKSVAGARLTLIHKEGKISNEQFDKIFEMIKSKDGETVELAVELILEYEKSSTN